MHHYITSSTALPAELIHLVFLRISQINGCAHCIDLHTRDLLKTMPIDKVALLPVWEEVPHLFPDQYRAALAWAEEVTRVGDPLQRRNPDARFRRGDTQQSGDDKPNDDVRGLLNILVNRAPSSAGWPQARHILHPKGRNTLFCAISRAPRWRHLA